LLLFAGILGFIFQNKGPAVRKLGNQFIVGTKAFPSEIDKVLEIHRPEQFQTVLVGGVEIREHLEKRRNWAGSQALRQIRGQQAFIFGLPDEADRKLLEEFGYASIRRTHFLIGLFGREIVF